MFSPIFQVFLFREDGLVCYDMSSAFGDGGEPLAGTGVVSCQIERVDLSAGRYFVDVGVYASDWSRAYDYHAKAYPLLVRGGAPSAVLNPPQHWWHHPGQP
ncbi:MAG: hypothetical protein R2909_07365 [Gemmatimonadales bacterium]